MAVQDTSSGKIIFADQLRGIAALLVVVNHYTGVYWGARPTVAHYLFAPVQGGPVPALVQGIVSIPVNPGALGVALFFMISGFVIPFSFRHHTTVSFLIARLLRVYPTYLVAMALGLIARLLSAHYWGQHFRIVPAVVIANALLVQDLAGVSTIDLVNWTLATELKFYLLFALGYRGIMRWRALFVIGVGGTAIAVNLLAVALMPHLPVRPAHVALTLGNEAMCVAFMMLGTLFFLNLRGVLSTAGLLGASAAGLGLFVFCWLTGTTADQFPVIMENYLYAWLAFAMCFFARRWFVPLAPLRFFAAVSYPLYLVHPMVGYVVMAVLIMGFGIDYPWAVAAAFATALALACGIHVLVERPSILWGRAIGRKAPVAAPVRETGASPMARPSGKANG